jgi:uncharacterized protein
MSVTANKQLMENIFAALAEGNGKVFLDHLAENFCWTITGSSAWSGTYRGKQVVQTDLLHPLFSQFAERYTNRAHRFIAEGEHVVVECRGNTTTKAGQSYRNSYCWICRIQDGKLAELTEYLDTRLVDQVLDPPPVSHAADSHPQGS